MDATSNANDLREEARFRASVKSLRQESGWSQKDLAQRMAEEGWSEYNQTTISRLESGHRPLTLAESKTLARIFRTSVEIMTTESSEEIRNFQELQAQAKSMYSMRQDLLGLADEYGQNIPWISVKLSQVQKNDVDKLVASSDGITEVEVRNTLALANLVLDTDQLISVLQRGILQEFVQQESREFTDDEAYPEYEVFDASQRGETTSPQKQENGE